jgi:hypothetical protein
VANLNEQSLDRLKTDLRTVYPSHRFDISKLDERSIAHFLFENRPVDRTHAARLGNCGELISLAMASSTVTPDDAVFLMLYLSALASAADIPEALPNVVGKVIQLAAKITPDFVGKVSGDFLGQLGKYFAKEILTSLKLRSLKDYEAFKAQLVAEVTSELPI